MDIIINLSDDELYGVVSSAKKLEFTTELFIKNAIKKAINLEEEKNMVNQSSLMNKALHNAFMKEVGEEFSLLDLLEDCWSKVASPRSFGRTFRKSLESSGLAVLSYKTSDNKAIYRREDNGSNVFIPNEN